MKHRKPKKDERTELERFLLNADELLEALVNCVGADPLNRADLAALLITKGRRLVLEQEHRPIIH